MFWRLASVSLLVLVIPATLHASIVIQPGSVDGEDAWVSQFNPGMNKGSDWQLGVGAGRSSLLQFDLTPLNSFSKVLSAKLWLRSPHAWMFGSGTVTRSISLHNVTDSWSESSVTWDTMPSFDTTPIATKDVTYTSTGPSGQWNKINTPKWMSFDVTSVVQDWLDVPATNNGFAMTMPGGDFWVRFYSSDVTNPGPWAHPGLEVDAVVPEPTSLAVWSVLGVFGLFVRRRKRRAESPQGHCVTVVSQDPRTTS